MQYTADYQSPLGKILLAADDIGLTGVWFEGQKYFPAQGCMEAMISETSVLTAAKRWLDIYFSGREPDFRISLHLTGTAFQKEVWKLLCAIPYGKTTTYGEIARKFAEKCGIARMSAQAVGGAVGRNKISVIVPCHRVVGSDGSLTGYAGGIDKKESLLRLEGIVI
ncbi:MAG: methylated-DNA--[protein]-cysteine S-methyltransferase [Alistipes sp.]|nr:methylated-DNA--[protein]-cysteine S-methyltransferase [Alistipes sp.]